MGTRSKHAGRVTPSKPQRRNPSIHVFADDQDGWLVYFSLSGSVARIDREWAGRFRAVENGDVSIADLQTELDTLGSSAGIELARLVLGGYVAETSALIDREHFLDVEALKAHSPRNLMFLVTDACNLKCAYCYELNQGVHKLGGNMNKATADKTLRQYFEKSKSRESVAITFFGGEPLINFPLLKYVTEKAQELALECGVTVGFTTTTNLTLMTEEILDFFVHHRFTVMVSIDGDQESHDLYRIDKSGNGTHARVVDNLGVLIQRFKEAGLRAPKLRATLAPGNEDAEAVYDYLTSLGTPLVDIGAVEQDPSDVQDVQEDIEVDVDDSNRPWRLATAALLRGDESWRDLVTPLMLKQLGKFASKLEGPILGGSGPKLCGVCRNMKAVSAKGDIYPCHRYVGMDKFKLGSVMEGGEDEDLVEYYYGKLNDSLGKKCSKCWAHVLCGGFCPWSLSNEDGSVSEPDENSCVEMRSNLEVVLRFYSAARERGYINAGE